MTQSVQMCAIIYKIGLNVNKINIVTKHFVVYFINLYGIVSFSYFHITHKKINIMKKAVLIILLSLSIVALRFAYYGNSTVKLAILFIIFTSVICAYIASPFNTNFFEKISKKWSEFWPERKSLIGTFSCRIKSKKTNAVKEREYRNIRYFGYDLEKLEALSLQLNTQLSEKLFVSKEIMEEKMADVYGIIEVKKKEALLLKKEAVHQYGTDTLSSALKQNLAHN